MYDGYSPRLTIFGAKNLYSILMRRFFCIGMYFSSKNKSERKYFNGLEVDTDKDLMAGRNGRQVQGGGVILEGWVTCPNRAGMITRNFLCCGEGYIFCSWFKYFGAYFLFSAIAGTKSLSVLVTSWLTAL